MRYEIINLKDIPDDLPPGKYQTRVVEANWDVIKLEFTGEEYDTNNPCLIPMIKSNDISIF